LSQTMFDSPIGTPSYWKKSTITLNERTPEALYEGKKEPEAQIVKSRYFREEPENVDFRTLIRYNDATPQISTAVYNYSELITGTEMTIESQNEKAKKIIDEWIRRTYFYDKFESLVTTLLVCGNALLEKLDEDDTRDVEEVDMSTIISKKRDEFGRLQYYEQRQQEGQIVKLGEGNLSRYIEFNLTNYSKGAWGRSLFYSLAVPRNSGFRHSAPLIEIMWGIEDAMGGIMLNNAFPITTITIPGANDALIKKETAKWARYKPGDKRIQKIKPEIEFFEPSEGSGRYQFIVEHMEKTFELGTQFPHDIMTGDFTSRASSETTENITLKRVRGFQRYLCNKLKGELFDPILLSSGIDPDEADLEIAFTTQNIIELEVNQVKDLKSQGLLSTNEAREWLRTNTGMELPDDDQILQDEEDKKQADLQPKIAPAVTAKMKDLESRIITLTTDKDTDKKIKEAQETLEHKLELVKEAIINGKETAAKRGNTVLEKILKELEEMQK